MTHEISWDNAEKTVVFQRYLLGATKDDLYHLAKKSSEMLASVPHTVHIIVDERNIDLVLTSSDMQYLGKLAPENQGAVVVIVPDYRFGYKQIVQNIGKKIAPSAFDQPFFAENVEDARKFLRENFGVVYEV